MEAIKIKGIARNGELRITVPASFNEQELEVIVLSNTLKNKTQNEIHEQKVQRLMSIVGTAKYPDLSPDILDVYEQ